MSWRWCGALPWCVVLMACGEPTEGVAPSDSAVEDTVPATEGCEGQDADLDGVDCTTDCDDADPLRFPGADERCNGLDDDCDGLTTGEELGGVAVEGLAETRVCSACDAAGLFAPLRASARTMAAAGGTPEDVVAAQYAVLAQHVRKFGFCPGAYSGQTTFMFVEMDKEEGTGEVEGVYTGARVAVGNEKPPADVMNTEHTWPRSLGADVGVAECDLNHLFPTDSDANNDRGNLVLDVLSGPETWSEGGSATDGQTFLPRASHRGNAARAMIYMLLRYDHLPQAPEDLPADGLSVYDDWHTADPVDAAEVRRALAILDRQDAANPLVVCPEAWDIVRSGL